MVKHYEYSKRVIFKSLCKMLQTVSLEIFGFFRQYSHSFCINFRNCTFFQRNPMSKLFLNASIARYLLHFCNRFEIFQTTQKIMYAISNHPEKSLLIFHMFAPHFFQVLRNTWYLDPLLHYVFTATSNFY